MHISKFRVSSEATGRLRVLRQRAALTPNLLCRMAMAMSFEMGKVGRPRRLRKVKSSTPIRFLAATSRSTPRCYDGWRLKTAKRSMTKN